MDRLFKYFYNKLIIIKDKLDKNNFTLSTAESCTGGLLGGIFTSIPGSSSFFQASIVVYSNEQKVKLLNVDKKILEKFGAVSKECAINMAKNVKNITNTDISISTTGIAGPDGGSIKKPVGTVYSAIVYKEEIYSFKFFFKGDRNKIRFLTIEQVLEHLNQLL